MQSKPTSVDHYLSELSEDRKTVFSKLRTTILENLPKGFEECISYGMIGYVVPHTIYPKGYHCDPKLPLPMLSIASQKGFIALYHMGIYFDTQIYDWFVTQFPKHTKYKLDMGKSCIRFKKMDGIPFELIAELVQKFSVARYIEVYENLLKK